MGGIFINYRRGETAGEARALFSDLSAKLGPDSVFMDVDNIAPGRDFRQVLQERLASVDVMLTLIGKDWIRSTDAAGRRRLDDANDFVRREIRAALERNINVTPLLLQGAQMPAEKDLPEDIRDLAYRNAFELSHTRWSSDVQELLKRLGLLKHEATNAEPSQPAALVEPAAVRAPSSPVAVGGTSHRGWIWPLAISLSVLVVVGTVGFLYYQDAEEKRVKLLLAQSEADERQLQTEAQLAAAKTEAGSAASAQAQRERERMERDTKELASAQAAQERLPTATPQQASAVKPSSPSAKSEWLVVVGSYARGDSRAAEQRRLVLLNAGHDVMTIETNDYALLRPNLRAVVIGPFASKEQASAALAKVRPTVPDAYLKQSR